jgi:hypothetical protein
MVAYLEYLVTLDAQQFSSINKLQLLLIPKFFSKIPFHYTRV